MAGGAAASLLMPPIAAGANLLLWPVEEAFRRYSEHVARGVLELMDVPVKVHDREFVDRVM